MNISAYILEYLKQFGAAVVPGFGVFSLEKSKAIINSENGSILPPASQIKFDVNYHIQSDNLAAYIGEQKQMSLEASKADLQIQTDFWKKKLQADQRLEIQNLGLIFIEEGQTHFKGNRLQSDHPDFYGLEEIKLSDIKSGEKETVNNIQKKDYKFGKILLWSLLIIIPIGVIAYFSIAQPEMIFGKPSFEKEKDSLKMIKPVKAPVFIPDSTLIKKDSLSKKILDSLKKDSTKTVQKQIKTPVSTNNTKTQWQK